jgi:glycosyltransferase involved in cell wall biosynthesis
MAAHAEIQANDAPTLESEVSTPGSLSLELSVVMPCLNERETVGTCVRKALASIRESNISGEVIVSDNGSTDGSVEIAQMEGARVVHVAEKGYGNALKAGILAARGTYVLMADSDDSHDLENLSPFLEKLRSGYDLVMGNRFKGGIEPGAMSWKNRYIGNPVLSFIGRLFFHAHVRDFHCGLRGFSQGAYQKMDLRTTGMEFASEMVIKARLMGLTMTEIPTFMSRDGRSRAPHLRPYRDGWRHLRFMLMYSPRWLFLYPGILLILLGLAGCAWLLPGPQFLRGVEFDVHTLLYAFVFIILGCQLVAFAVFTKIFAISEGLLPEDPSLTRAFRYITLEKGLIAGALLIAFGLGGSIYAVSGCVRGSCSTLDGGHLLRIVMPAVFSLMLGVQTVCGSFFLSILGLRRR